MKLLITNDSKHKKFKARFIKIKKRTFFHSLKIVTTKNIRKDYIK